MTSFKAAVRSASLKSIGSGRAGIGAAESHAKRLDPVAKSRRIRESDPLAWSKGSGALDYVEAFKNHKKEFSASERANSGLAMEFKIVVSPEWVKETGSAHDPNNPRVKQLYDEALKWAESWGGSGSVWGMRYDTDEKGSGVVDVFMSPIREQKHKSGKTKQVVSCRKAKEELLAFEKAIDPSIRTSGAAMQSSWARWCQEHLDHRIERGTPKAETQAEHIHADVYAKAAEETQQLFEAHLFPDPFAPPTLPTPEQARLIAKLETIKETAAKKAADEARRAEADRYRASEAKLQEAVQRANLKEIELSQKEKELELKITKFEGERHAALLQVSKDFKREQQNITKGLQTAFGLSKDEFDLDIKDIYAFFINRFQDESDKNVITFGEFEKYVIRELSTILLEKQKENKGFTKIRIEALTGREYLQNYLYNSRYQPKITSHEDDRKSNINADISKLLYDCASFWERVFENSEKLLTKNLQSKSVAQFIEHFGEMSTSRAMALKLVKPIEEIWKGLDYSSSWNPDLKITHRESLLHKAVLAVSFGIALTEIIVWSLERASRNIKQYAERINSTQKIAKDLKIDPEQRYKRSDLSL